MDAHAAETPRVGIYLIERHDPRPAAVPDPVTDESLAASFVSGDETCFARLVERYRGPLVRFVRCYLGRAGHLAEDVSQEVFLQVYRSVASFEGRSSFRTWLYSVARNVCRAEMRRRNEPAEELPETEEALLSIPDGAPDPHQALQNQETSRLLRDAILALPVPLRTALVLRDADGLSYEEIAQVLSVPVGTVRSRLHNARARLAQSLVGIRS